MYWISWLNTSTPAVIGRSNRNGSVNADLVVLRAVALLRRHAEGLAAAEEVRRLERQLPEEAVVLRDAGAERDLVAVLLLELQLDVDLVLGVRRLLDVDRLRPSSGLK